MSVKITLRQFAQLESRALMSVVRTSAEANAVLRVGEYIFEPQHRARVRRKRPSVRRRK